MTDYSDFVSAAIDSTIRRAKAEILRDIADGTIESTPQSLSDLDEWIDITCLGGMCDDWLYDGETWPDSDLVVESSDRVQAAVNDWIEGGGLADARHQGADA